MSVLTENQTAAYDADFYSWTQEQARLLRRLKTIDLMLPDGLDVDHVAEEIEDMGRSALDAVESQIENIFVHVLKFVSAPDAPPAKKWRAEANRFSTDLVRRYTHSMRQRIDTDRIWHLALRRARTDMDVYDDRLVEGLPARCPFSLEEFINEDFNFDTLIAKLRLMTN